MEMGGGRFFTTDELLESASEIFVPVPPDLADRLKGEFGIIRERSWDRYEFYHIWCQEFLAAKEIIRLKQPLREVFDNPKFMNALPYTVGLLKSPRGALEVLRTVPIYDLFTFCRSVAEGGFARQGQEILELLMRALQVGEDSSVPVREVMSKAVAEAGLTVLSALYRILHEERNSDYIRRSALEAVVILDEEIEPLNTELVQLLRTGCTGCNGLLWHVIEQIGLRRVEEAKEGLEQLCHDKEPITAGDSMWALGRITGQQPTEIRTELVDALLLQLWGEDRHVQGHALRTIGRLKIKQAVPQLSKYLSNSKNAYRWIVLEAAAAIDGEDVIDLFRKALHDIEKLVVAQALRSLRDLTVVIPKDVVQTVENLTRDTSRIGGMAQTVSRIAKTTIEKILQRKYQGTLAKIYVARHCKTQWNLEGKVQGKREDLPLCEDGRLEARRVAKNVQSLGIGRIVTSTADRAQQTGKIYADALGIPLQVNPRLRELDHGKWEGRRFDELESDLSSSFARWLDNPTSIDEIPEGQENTVAAQHRIVQAICEIALEYRGQTVLVVAHKHINALLMCRILGKPLTAFRSLVQESVEPHLLPADALKKLCCPNHENLDSSPFFC
jgi:broad specificity phosphatase PhoE/HEAT repeat protein